MNKTLKLALLSKQLLLVLTVLQIYNIEPHNRTKSLFHSHSFLKQTAIQTNLALVASRTSTVDLQGHRFHYCCVCYAELTSTRLIVINRGSHFNADNFGKISSIKLWCNLSPDSIDPPSLSLCTSQFCGQKRGLLIKTLFRSKNKHRVNGLSFCI